MEIFDHQRGPLYYAVTEDIKVSVVPEYHYDSSAERNIYVWRYNIKIENLNNTIIQILGRRWMIFDRNGMVEEVKGPGVVGLQPIIKPYKNFSYSSEVRLRTNSGAMLGEYFGIDTNSTRQITIKIPAFSLDIDLSLIVPN